MFGVGGRYEVDGEIFRRRGGEWKEKEEKTTD